MGAERERARGFALIVVLWLGILLGILATSFTFNTRLETRLASNALGHEKARLDADAGIQRALVGLLSNDPENSWPVDGSSRELEFDGASISIRVRAESGKIDLNAAPAEMLLGLVRELVRAEEDSNPSATESDPERIVDAILDWRDADDSPRPRVSAPPSTSTSICTC